MRCQLAALVGAVVLVACATSVPPVATREARAAPPEQPGAAVTTATPSRTPTATAPAPQPISTPVRTFALAPEAAVDGPPLVRVMLQRSQSVIRVPQPGRRYRLRTGSAEQLLRGPLTIQRVVLPVWQVAAVRDTTAAETVGRRVRSVLGGDAAIQLVPGGEYVRVRVTSGLPEIGQRLRDLGYADAFIAERRARVQVSGGEGGAITSSDEIELEPMSDWPVLVGTHRYRGDFRARLSGGSVLLINVLNLEWYLRGVVPAEMGPYVFPELEAIKAQTVAARTYVVAHLGDHDDEGYDLCATPACQAYHGVDVEHAMSNRAVDETRGLVASFAGRPIDAMYSSTSGGHTEHAALLFPDRAAPYLQGRPTRSDGEPLRLRGADADGAWLGPAEWRRWLALRVLGFDSGAAVSIPTVLERLADLCGGTVLAVGTDPPAASLAQAVLAAGGLEESGALTRVSDPVWGMLALADLYDIELAPPPAVASLSWALDAAAAIVEMHELVTGESGVAVPIPPDGVGLRPPRSDALQPILQPVPLFERWQEQRRARAAMVLAAGTELDRISIGEEVLAIEVVTSGGGDEADRRSSWRGWRRERTWPELAQAVGVPDLERLEVVRRGVSGRVVELAAVGASGQRKGWTGFQIRRVLDLPETLFTVHVLMRPDGTKVARFLGRGWGHGVGMCQNGAYGLARAGLDFVEILATFYRGVEIVPMASLASAGQRSQR